MLDARVPTTFKDRQETGDIRFGVGEGVLYGVTHTRLGGQMNHSIKPVVGKKAGHAISIRAIHLQELEARILLHQAQSGFFEFGIVVIVQIIQTYNLVPPSEQCTPHCGSNETCCTS